MNPTCEVGENNMFSHKATINPATGVAAVRDPKLDRLFEIYKSGKRVGTALSVVDIAGLTKGASEGAGLGNEFLANVQAGELEDYLNNFARNL